MGSTLSTKVDAVFARGAAEAVAMIATLVTRVSKRGFLRGKLVVFALDRARKLAGLRERPKYYAIVVLSAMRRELARIGDELASQGRNEAADDIFFLGFVGVRAAIDGHDMRALVAGRREA
jgi:pyruvate,water dikinase